MRLLYSIALLIPLAVVQFQTLKTASTVIETDARAINTTSIVIANDTAQAAGNGFNYTAFWQDAMDAAFKSLHAESTLPQRHSPFSCPKVFVYDLPFKSMDVRTKSSGFGMKVKQQNFLQGHLYKTNQYAFASILEERLRNSQDCRTKDPNDADLFYAPVLPASKDGGMWKKACSQISGETVRDALPYLNSTNACRHFLAIGKGHTDVTSCDGWFSNPIRELHPMLRLAYSNYSFVRDKHGAHYYDTNDTTNKTYPNLFSVPYPSSLHFRHNDIKLSDRLYTTKRKVLMLFMGKDGHGDVPVRKQMSKMCKKYDNKICNFQKWKGTPDFITAKAKATFCLEPAGDTPGRKSLADSITFGCIPILFSELTDDVAPWFWSDWKDRARVLVPRDDFVAGRIDLKQLLQTMPQDLLELMKKTLKGKAREFQYSLDDDQEDGVRVILDNLHREALGRERQGVCGY